MLKTSLASLIAFNIANCAGKPLNVTACVSDPPSGGFQCSVMGKDAVFLPYDASGNYVAFPPKDAKKIYDRLLECKRKPNVLETENGN